MYLDSIKDVQYIINLSINIQAPSSAIQRKLIEYSIDAVYCNSSALL